MCFYDFSDCLVLRIYSRDPNACRKELNILRSALGHLPVPEIVDFQEDGDEDIGPYVLYRHCEGITFQELKSNGRSQDMAEAAYAIGKALAIVGTISIPQSSRENIDACRRAPYEFLCSPIRERRLGQWETDRLRNFVFYWLPRIRSVYDDRVLVHGDFNNRNTIIKRDGDHWIVSGILDWELAFSGSPLWDAARFICFERKGRPCREPHFSMGFHEGGGVLPREWRAFSRALNVVSAAESLSRFDLPARFAPELRNLITAAMENRDPA